MSENFTEMADNPSYRAKFVKNAIKFMRETNFNGIDIDWEYPVAGA